MSFVKLDIRELNSVTEGKGGFFSSAPSKDKLSESGEIISIRNEDISYLKEAKDDYGTSYTLVYLSDNSDLYYEIEEDYVIIPGTVEQNIKLLNVNLQALVQV